MQQGLAKLTRDQYLVLGSLVGITLLAWLYLVHMAWRMPEMDMGGAMMMAHPQGTSTQFALTALMWAVMMVGMMLPSAMPMILLFAMVQRRHAARPRLSVAAFVAGYLLVWGAFSVAAAALQTLLASMMLLGPTISLTRHLDWWAPVPRSWGLRILAIEGAVPRSLSKPVGVHHGALAIRPLGRGADGG